MNRITAFPWYGGKARMVNIMSSMIISADIYLEAFAGAGSVLLNKARCLHKVEILNDLDLEVYQFFKGLADKEIGASVEKRICSLSYSQELFDKALDCKKKGYKGLDETEKAVMSYIILSQSYNGLKKNFAKGKYEDTFQYRRNLKANIPAIRDRLKNVQVKNEDALSLIEKYRDNERAFIFLDPPYRLKLRKVRGYEHEFEEESHIRMLEQIKDAKAKIVLCGYHKDTEDLYDTNLEVNNNDSNWNCYLVGEFKKPTRKGGARKSAKEFVWLNFELPERAKFLVNQNWRGADAGQGMQNIGEVSSYY